MSFRAILKFVLFVFIALVPVGARAQQTGATVHGAITDPDDAVIPGAVVTLTPASGKAFIAQSQNDGTYVLKGVPAGTFSLTGSPQGFPFFFNDCVRIALRESRRHALE